jgi:TetR/AcrR family transcriptional regulator, mexCD-oprJ operon repressor
VVEATPTPRRADARHNAQRIVDAAIHCLSEDHRATVGEIAATAGVGRVTLYGHFPSRSALVEAALTQVLEAGDTTLGALDVDGDPVESLVAVIGSSWQLTAQAGSVLEAAREELPAGRIQDLHAKLALRVEELIKRGQATGSFRTDLPASWLVSTLHHLMKGVASDVARGSLPTAEAPRLISAIATSAFAPPAQQSS